MPTYRYGGTKGRAFKLDESKDMVAVRTESRNLLEDVPLSATSRRALEGFDPLVTIREAGVQVYKAVKEPAGKSSEMPDVAFTKAAPLAGGPFVTLPSTATTKDREPRSRSME